MRTSKISKRGFKIKKKGDNIPTAAALWSIF
jgi:hypothetical protein